MKEKIIFIIFSVAFSLMAFMLTPIQWLSNDTAMGTPPANLLLPFMLVTGFEALAFGVGMAFLVLYWEKGAGRRWAFLSVVWALISWWPHDNLHRSLPNGDFAGLLYIEIGFHITVIIAGLIIAYYFVTKKPNENNVSKL